MTDFSLPIRTTMEDVEALTGYLVTKPIGATLAEARAVVDGSVLDGRKLNAMKAWDLIEENGGRIRLTERGRRGAKDKGVALSAVLLEVIHAIPAYAAVIERAVHKSEFTVTAVEIASHWHDHFKSVASSAEKILNDQAVCFFQLAQGADLGELIVGRKGSPTRFEFSKDAVTVFAEGTVASVTEVPEYVEKQDTPDPQLNNDAATTLTIVPKLTSIQRVFITHGKNKKVLEQIKEIVSFGNFIPVVAQERESAAKPVPDKVMDEMRGCQAAVIHVSAEGTYTDAGGKEHPHINENVLIEIGAAMALYRANFILVVEDGLRLPSNLSGLYECRYVGDELNNAATMKLLKAFNEFREKVAAV
jgi:predicted nucleotide-binding protein